MSYLQRTASAGLTIDKAFKLSEIEQLKAENRIDEAFLPIEYGISDLEKVELTEAQVSEIGLGVSSRLLLRTKLSQVFKTVSLSQY
jgi:tRNA pseudouridine55 synthase